VGTSSVNCVTSRLSGTASNIATTEIQDSHVTQTLPHFLTTELQPPDHNSAVATCRITVNHFCIQEGYSGFSKALVKGTKLQDTITLRKISEPEL